MNQSLLCETEQSYITPLGLAIKDQNGLFITPLRIIPTTLLKGVFEHKISFIDVEMINHNTKRANFSAMNYYLTDKVPEIKKGLVTKLMHSYLQRPYVFDCELKDLPIEVVNRYNENITSYKNKCYLDYSQRKFREYIFRLEFERRYLRIHDRNTGERSLMLLETRYSNSYCKKIEGRMKYLSYAYRNKPSVLLTLTFDPKRFACDKLHMAQIMNKEVNRFLEALRIYFKREGRAFPKFIRSPEFQKNGNPHTHLVFLGASRLVDWRKIRDLWGNGFIYINRTSKDARVKYPINYITKYITKTFTNYNYENVLTQALVWINGMRSFSCSRALIAPLKCASSGDWLASYLVVCDRRSSDLDEMDIINERENLMFSPAAWDPPPEYNGAATAAAWKRGLERERTRLCKERN